ncbi:MAG: MFS transporter [Eggerthellaceae bacterium]|nr:MFS transporter [Eggerthellaceae bacterium]
MASPENDEEQKQPKLFSAIFIAVVGVALFSFISGQGLNAGTSVYVDRLGGTATFAGLTGSVFSAAALVSRLVAGPMADKRGRFVVMLSGGLIMFAGMVGAAVFDGLDTLLLWRVLQGVGFSATTTAAATAAADVLPVERLGEGIGYYGLGQAIAMAVGPALAIGLVAFEPPSVLFRGFAVAAGIVVLLCFACRYERHPERLPETATYRIELAKAKDESAESAKPKESRLKSFFVREALAGGIPILVLTPAYSFGVFFVSLLGATMGVGNAGLFFTLSAVVMIIIRLSSKAFMDRILPIKLFSAAVVAGIVCFSLLLVTSLPVLDAGARDIVFYAAGVFYGLFLGVALPVNQTVAVKNSPSDRWGAANGLYFMLMDVGFIIASILWGMTNDAFGFTFSLVGVLGFLVASIIVAYLAYPPFAKRREEKK